MDTAEKIKLLLGELRLNALRAFDRQIWKIYSDNYVIPVSMVHEAVRAAEDNISRLLPEAISGALALSEGPDAFRLVHDAMAGHLLDLERKIEQGCGSPLRPETLKVAGERFAAVRQRSSQNLENHRSYFTGSKNTGGRPRKWDWEGALIHLIAEANKPDGLFTDQGIKQAQIEKIMRDWFILKKRDAPADSEIRNRASEIMKVISKPQKAGN
ncbi:hypothetical protein [Methylocystis heyeri]|uniref:hypothetical protein n=1 Tax=Methylocystis heyeri TaxID=391905 RepID=UPI00192A61DC|nr:hypothetical protein [Methylocystis heyeri]